MTNNLGIRVVVLQTTQQCSERLFLGWRSGVGRQAVLVQSAFLADADAVGIIMTCVHAHLIFRPGLEHLSITLYVVVIAHALVVESGIMTVFQIVHREAPVAFRGAAMNHNQVYCAHDCTAIVLRTAVITVAINLRTLATLVQFTLIIIEKIN